MVATEKGEKYSKGEFNCHSEKYTAVEEKECTKFKTTFRPYAPAREKPLRYI